MLPSLNHSLSIESSSTEDAPFTLAGQTCTVMGSENAGIRAVAVNGKQMLGTCGVANGRCTWFRITPIGIERKLLVGSVAVIEKTIVSPTDGAFAVEWVADEHVDLTMVVLDQANDVDLVWCEGPDSNRVRLSPRQPCTLVVSADKGVANVEPAGWVRMHRAAADRRNAELLRLNFPSNEVNAALAWAEYRVAASSPDSLHAILTLIAMGDFKRARAVISGVPSDDDFLALLGSFFAASGDHAFARAQWQRVRDATSARLDGLAPQTLRDIARVAEAIGEAEATELLRRARGGTTTPLWPDFARGETSAAVHRWQQLALACFEDEKGAWPNEPGQSAADVVLGLLYGMLGFEPDAFRGRLRLRPQFPSGFSRASVHNLLMGDASVELEYARCEDGWRFALSQTAGAYPVRLIFEPALSAPPRRVLIDGMKAELDLAPFGERVIAPMQLMLDERRQIEFYA